MIYIIKDINENKITTESWLDFIPGDFVVYFNDELIGTYVNESQYKTFIQLTIPTADLPSDLMLKEYTLKLYHNLALLKVDLVYVIESTSTTIISNDYVNNLIMRENE